MSGSRWIAEQTRPDEARERKIPWKNWGPYLSERQCSETCRPHPGPLPEGEGEVFSVNLMMGFLVPIRR